jgi:hypothetical protein
MSLATVAATEPARHALMTPDCECGAGAPTWARRRGKSRRFTQAVTLVAALEREDASARAGMVARHRECLARLTAAADGMLSATSRDELERPEAGLALLMFAAELAAAVRPDAYRAELPGELVAACEQAISAATLVASACVSEFAEAFQTVSAIVG